MKIIEYILEYIEERGISYINEDEYTNMLEGIKLYLLENGFEEYETKKYYIEYVTKHLKSIAPIDIKEYFICYPYISKINQIIIENRSQDIKKLDRTEELIVLINSIRKYSLGEKYIPVDEIKRLLGNKY